MLTIIKFIAQFGIKAALKKYGKAAITRVAKNHGLVKNVKKVIPKAKGLTAKQQAKRQLAIEKTKVPKPKGKPIGYVIQNFRGKPKPYYKKD